MDSRKPNIELKRKIIVEEIKKAFKDVPYPGLAKLMHPSCDSGDDSDIIAFYRIKSWEKVPEQTIIEEYAAMSFFSPEGFQYFLPAFMTWSVKNAEKSDAFVIDSTIYNLNPIRRGKLNEFTVSKYARLTQDQKRCIVLFLEFMRDSMVGFVDSYSAAIALRAYWNSVY